MYIEEIFVSNIWYYVSGKDRVGPINEDNIKLLFKQEKINENSYLWKEGFDNWKKLSDIEALKHLTLPPPSLTIPPIPDSNAMNTETNPSLFQWSNIKDDDPSIFIKVGHDRNAQNDGAEYGPFSINQLKKAFEEKRINEKTFIYTKGIDNWIFLGDSEIFGKISNSNKVPNIDASDRRITPRKPFVARILFSDNNDIFEGICRDISVGGLQVLISKPPVSVGQKVNLNVHPNDTEYNIVASGEVVRILDGNTGFSMRFDDLNPEMTNIIQRYTHNTKT